MHKIFIILFFNFASYSFEISRVRAVYETFAHVIASSRHLSFVTLFLFVVDGKARL